MTVISTIKPIGPTPEAWTPWTKSGTAVPHEKVPKTTLFAGWTEVWGEGIYDEWEEKDTSLP